MSIERGTPPAESAECPSVWRCRDCHYRPNVVLVSTSRPDMDNTTHSVTQKGGQRCIRDFISPSYPRNRNAIHARGPTMLSLLVLKSSVGDLPTHIKLTAQCNPMSQRSTFKLQASTVPSAHTRAFCCRVPEPCAVRQAIKRMH